MVSHTSRSPKSPALSGGEEAQTKRDKEMKDMVTALTQRLVDLQAATKHDGLQDEDDDKHGRSIITLTGKNTGATMRFLHSDQKLEHAADDSDEDVQGVYTNSNFQGLNNSIMLNGHYKAKDPGVHMVVSDYADEHGNQPGGKSKGKKKGKETSDSESSDSD